MVRWGVVFESIHISLSRVNAIGHHSPENVADAVVPCRFSVGRLLLYDGPLP